ncbi:hypothetical protein CUT44_11795 [Streptomyces carminius]|uniref:Uncharacterized protein n=1 Tax=Streptomyces carminius TaxID=2665496 RepID=A0A2M8M0Q5_9ACTN|nr:hypothetical protein CUT44_15050 [Streptomyces carminius]PJE97793.1 hypothetical protein CUT44_11795 [Streptomyces carminius]
MEVGVRHVCVQVTSWFRRRTPRLPARSGRPPRLRAARGPGGGPGAAGPAGRAGRGAGGGGGAAAVGGRVAARPDLRGAG